MSIKVKVDEKYTVYLPEQKGETLHATRYHEEWRDLTGDNLVYALAYELNEARKSDVIPEKEDTSPP